MKNETYKTIIEGTNDLYYGFRADGITARINEYNKNSACLSYKNAVRSLRKKWFSSNDWFIEMIRKLDDDNITLNTCDDIYDLWKEAILELEIEATSIISDILIKYLDDMVFMKINTWIVSTIDEKKLTKKNKLLVGNKYLRLDYSTDKNCKTTKRQFKALTKNLAIRKWVYQMNEEVKYHINNEVLKSLHEIYDVNGVSDRNIINSLKINIIKEVMDHDVDDYIAIKITNGKRQRLIDDEKDKIDDKVQKAINKVCGKLYTILKHDYYRDVYNYDKEKEDSLDLKGRSSEYERAINLTKSKGTPYVFNYNIFQRIAERLLAKSYYKNIEKSSLYIDLSCDNADVNRLVEEFIQEDPNLKFDVSFLFTQTFMDLSIKKEFETDNKTILSMDNVYPIFSKLHEMFLQTPHTKDCEIEKLIHILELEDKDELKIKNSEDKMKSRKKLIAIVEYYTNCAITSIYLKYKKDIEKYFKQFTDSQKEKLELKQWQKNLLEEAMIPLINNVLLPDAVKYQENNKAYINELNQLVESLYIAIKREEKESNIKSIANKLYKTVNDKCIIQKKLSS